jgi:hypothetical protein
MLRDLRRGPLGRPQLEDSAQEAIPVVQRVVPPEWAEDLVPADEPAGPVNAHARGLGPALDRYDDPFDQMMDDRLAVRGCGPGGPPRRGDVGGERRDPGPLVGG